MMLCHNILITGANGLLGRHACAYLRSTYHVHALVHKKPELPISNVEYYEIDFTNQWGIADLPRDIDIIIHLAQSSKFRDFPKQAMDVFDVNIRSTAMLLDYAYKIKAKHFIYASSGGLYGSGHYEFNEKAPIDAMKNLGYYLSSKLCGEILTQDYANFMTVSALRFFFMYGKGQDRGMLLPRIVDNIKKDKPILLQGKEGLLINPVHVEDVVIGLEQLFTENKSKVINIAGAEIFSLKKIAEMIGEAVGCVPIFEYMDNTPKNMVADISSMKIYLKAPQKPFKEGLKDIL